MHLKRIDILGFKSFANKTSIRFSSGVTAIVGPNGCGKTNVLDALRWVLGEQKPSLLRGGKMEEIIFNGTREIKPLGMAEVTLTISNENGVLATEYNELQVTRRLFRSGESEYLMNKVPCRLRDIIDMFADTGLGAHSYSVIQQDMIDSVISDKAEERRFLFEEAAGITKYKQRRKAALRKLEATEQDFLRLQDIYSEVKTRVNSLYRQHKKAERYQNVVTELKDWEIYIGSKRVSKLQIERRELMGDKDRVSRENMEYDTKLEKLSAALETDRTSLLDIERAITETVTSIQQLSDKAHICEREISVLKEKRSNALQLIEKNESEIDRLRARNEELAGQLDESEKLIAERKNSLENSSTRLQQADQAQKIADQNLMNARASRENENSRLLELEGKLSSGLAEESSLREQQAELISQIAILDERIRENEPRQQEAARLLSERQSEFDKISESRRNAESKRTNLNETMEILSEKSETLAQEIADLNASIEAADARRSLLNEMILHYEGYEAGVVTAMEERDRFAGIVGTVAELFVPVEGMEMAAEAALGEMARFIVCDNRNTAESVISYLGQEKKGRVGILVPETGTILPSVKRPEMNIPGVIGWLDSFVSVDEKLRPLRDAILARTIVFKAGTDPTAILERLPFGFGAVSSDGIFYQSNSIAGGSDDQFPLFRRKEKIEELGIEAETLRAGKKALEDDRGRTLSEIAAARAESTEVLSEISDLTERLDQMRSIVNEVEFRCRSLNEEAGRISKEKSILSKRTEGLQDRQYNLGLDSTTLASEKESLVRTIDLKGSQLGDFETAASLAVEESSKAQVALIEAQSALDQAENNCRHLTQLKQEIEQTTELRTIEITKAKELIESANRTAATLEESLKDDFERREQLTVMQTEKREQQNEILVRVKDAESSIKSLRRTRDEVSQRLHELDIRLTTLDSELNTLIERVREEHDVDLTEVTTDRPEGDISDEQAPNHLMELKEKLKKFGAVNLLALEEYREVSEREKFLREQLDDLDAAKKDLNSTILKINHTARELFDDTIKKARVNFKNLFVELFAGGEADITLADPNDPLESDIEIIARPRGKRLLSITMMSGGERALTAIALLFALYLVKPSPFCILDEIDAPLDDANCHRFLGIIKNFSHQTQFIVITHNKITMESANNLYGVTMEQPGISKIVGVRFDDSSPDKEAETVRLELTEVTTKTDDAEQSELPEPIHERLHSEVKIKGEQDS